MQVELLIDKLVLTKLTREDKSMISNEIKYKKAILLYDDEKYEQALMLLQDTDSEKSKYYIDKCKVKIEELKQQENEMIFSQANQLMMDKKFQEALDAYNLIKGYKQSDIFAEYCESEIIKLTYKKEDEIYENATELFVQHQFQEALDQFRQISYYKSSKQYIMLCEKEIEKLDGDYYYKRAGECLEKEDYTHAMIFYLKADELLNAEAAYQIGKLYEKGLGVSSDYHKAMDWYEKGANQNDKNACILLGSHYEEEGKYKDALFWYSKAFELGKEMAANFIGVLYEKGLGVSKDYKKAMEWYEKGANLGDEYACYNLAYSYEIYEFNYSKALEWYEKAYELGDEVKQKINKLRDILGIRANETIIAPIEKKLDKDAQYDMAYKRYLEDDYEEAKKLFELTKGYKETDFVLTFINNKLKGEYFRQGYLMYEMKEYKDALLFIHKADELGHPKAADIIGDAYRKGYGVKKNIDEAKKWYLKSIEQGEYMSCLNLADCYFEENHLVQGEYWKNEAQERENKISEFLDMADDYFSKGKKEIAFDYYMKAYNIGFKRISTYIGLCYYNGNGVQKNEKKALEWFLIGVNNEDTDAYYYVGLYLQVEEQKYQDALKWYIRAYELGCEVAANEIGTLYDNALLGERDYKKAMEWYEKGAKSDEVTSLVNLGHRYHYDECNYSEAMKLYLRAYELGNYNATVDIGLLYENGYGVPKNVKEAKKWYSIGVNNDIPYAFYNYAVCLFRDEDKYKEAMEYYLKADSLGVVQAANSIGVMYNDGIGVEQNYKIAKEWFLKAAKNNDEQACYNLGLYYSNVEKDYAKAYVWYKKALDLGDENASERIKELRTEGLL